MKALITGLSGFVASHLAEFLLKNTEWDIIGTLRWSDPLDNLFEIKDRINRNDRVRIVYADLTDAWSMIRAVQDSQPDYVFHLAAQSYPQTSFTSPHETINVNVNGTLNLLEAIRNESPHAKVHVCSSSEVYGRVDSKYIPISEECPFHPTSPYAISKVGTDLLGRHYARAYGMNIIVTRMFTHTGPRRGDVFAESSFAKQIAMIENGLIEPSVKVGNLASVRTIADVRDAVRAYYMLLTVNPIAGEVYNIGGSHTCTIGDILECLFEISGKHYDIEIDPKRMRPVDADNQVPDCSRFMSHAGWKAEVPFEKTMTDLLDYWRERIKTNVVIQR